MKGTEKARETQDRYIALDIHQERDAGGGARGGAAGSGLYHLLTSDYGYSDE